MYLQFFEIPCSGKRYEPIGLIFYKYLFYHIPPLSIIKISDFSIHPNMHMRYRRRNFSSNWQQVVYGCIKVDNHGIIVRDQDLILIQSIIIPFLGGFILLTKPYSSHSSICLSITESVYKNCTSQRPQN